MSRFFFAQTYSEGVRELRILPLLSSATEIIHALGLGAFQVGRSHECDFPPETQALPVCTRPSISVEGSSADIDRNVKQRLASALSIYEVDTEAIRRLRPTHVITQSQCEVCAVSLRDVERALEEELATTTRVVSLQPYELRDLWSDIRRVAEAMQESAAGEALVSRLQHRMEEMELRARQAIRRPRVAAIEWMEPLMAAGNWVPELIEKAGGENLFGVAGQHSPWMTWDELAAADPDAIVALPCGFDLQRTHEEMHWLTDRPGWSMLKAVRTNQVFVCDGNQFMNRSGPRLVESLQIFGEILHPELFSPALQGVGWRRF